MDDLLGLDLLSDLPVGIIEKILSFLPIRDAIRTSILSSRWRYIWVTLPQLVFDDDIMGPLAREGEIPEAEDHMKRFITQTLLRHEGHIIKFGLHSSKMDSCVATDHWLLFLSRKDIKELILQMGGFEDIKEYFHVPSCLYNCRKLTFLELGGCEFGLPPPAFKGFLCLRTLILQNVEAPFRAIETLIANAPRLKYLRIQYALTRSFVFYPPPPTFKGFLCLKTLILLHVGADSGTIETLVANAPILENLQCVCFGSSELRFSAPNLRYFYLETTCKVVCVCAPLLAEMDIVLNMAADNGNEEVEELMDEQSVCSYTEFLGGVTNLERLYGGDDFTKHLGIGMEYYCNPLVFHHLKVIALSAVNFNDVNQILVVVHLIMGATNLRELKVITKAPPLDFWGSHGKVDTASKAPPTDFWDSHFLQNCRFENLKVIHMNGFRGELHEVKLIKYLLERSPVLETMNVKSPPNPSTEQEILSHRRASVNAKILFQKRNRFNCLIDPPVLQENN